MSCKEEEVYLHVVGIVVTPVIKEMNQFNLGFKSPAGAITRTTLC